MKLSGNAGVMDRDGVTSRTIFGHICRYEIRCCKGIVTMRNGVGPEGHCSEVGPEVGPGCSGQCLGSFADQILPGGDIPICHVFSMSSPFLPYQAATRMRSKTAIRCHIWPAILPFFCHLELQHGNVMQRDAVQREV